MNIETSILVTSIHKLIIKNFVSKIENSILDSDINNYINIDFSINSITNTDNNADNNSAAISSIPAHNLTYDNSPGSFTTAAMTLQHGIICPYSYLEE